jgi:23S rRNA pseudouridine2605 synthase
VTEGTRLNKYIAQAGVASRRRADELISYGKVRVNGKVVRELGTIVMPGDKVDVSGTPVAPVEQMAYLVVHKPAGVMTTMRDPQGRRTVGELVPKRMPRVVPVGRLDYDTAGVLLMTNDGELANRLLHPRYGVEKTYRATIAGRLSPDDVKRLHDGVLLGSDDRAASAKVRVVSVRAAMSVVDITIHEGRNRQVRRMFESLGHPVQALVRLRFGPIALGDLPVGHTRALTAKELSALRRVKPQDDRPSIP